MPWPIFASFSYLESSSQYGNGLLVSYGAYFALLELPAEAIAFEEELRKHTTSGVISACPPLLCVVFLPECEQQCHVAFMYRMSTQRYTEYSDKFANDAHTRYSYQCWCRRAIVLALETEVKHDGS